MAVGAPELVRSPLWLPLEVLETGTVRLMRLDEAAYRAAAFLDQRLLAGSLAQERCSLAALRAAAARLPARPQFIFHIGHVGSTLIARLLGEHPGVFALREPALLRTLAAPGTPAAPVTDLDTLLALLGRSWRPGQQALVKATSFVSELAGAILAASGAPPVLLVYAQPLAYISGILAGPNSRHEARQLQAARRARLARRLGEDPAALAPRSEGEAIALSWLAEMTALAAAAPQGRALWVDFDAFLDAPEAGLEAMFVALGHAVAPPQLGALVRGPLMNRYSKALEHPYDAALRRQLLAQARAGERAEIARGLEYLGRLAARHPTVAAVMARAGAPPARP